MLETDVDEKYYLSDERLSAIKAWEDRQKENGRGFRFEVKDGESIGRSITTSGDRPSSTNYVKVERIGGIYDKDGQTHQAGSIYDDGGLAPTLSTMQGGHQEPLIAQPVKRRRSEYGKEVRKAYENHELPHSEAMRECYVGNDGIMPTLTSSRREQKIAIKTANSKGYDLAEDGDGIDLAYPDSQTRRGRVGHGVSKTLPTSDSQGVVQNYRIRKLTPKECWRLMGFNDIDFDKAEKVNSNTQLYKQAGNSIVVDVLEKVLSNLLLTCAKEGE